MNCASTRAGRRATRRAGFTFLEMLIAAAIATVLLAGLYVMFNQVLQTQRVVAARLTALSNGRAAISSISDEIKQLNVDSSPSQLFFVGANPEPRSFGDFKDDDGDDLFDEEVLDGINDDDPGTDPPNLAALERHAVLDDTSGLTERPEGLGRLDLGDLDVDEDVVWGRDFIIFQSQPETPDNIESKFVGYFLLDEFDGQENVLVRQTNIERSGFDPTLDGIAPIAFGVVGFDLLYWDSNADAEDQRWLTEWQSDLKTFETFPLPAAVYIRITLNADERPHETLPLGIRGVPIDTVVVDTVVNIESVIDDLRFDRPSL